MIKIPKRLNWGLNVIYEPLTSHIITRFMCTEIQNHIQVTSCMSKAHYAMILQSMP